MSQAKSGLSARGKHYIHCVVMLAILVIIGNLPTFASITPLDMWVLGIFIASIYGWCTLGLLWPSLFAITAIGLTGYCTVSESFTQAFGNDTVIVLVCVFTFAAYLEESGLSQYIANWLLAAKSGKGALGFLLV